MQHVDLTNAIVKITSAAAENANFGTGFVIWRDADGDYVLTCKHVVNAVGQTTILIDDAPAQEIAGGHEAGRDLAVLRVAPGALHAEPLRLSAALMSCGECVTQGVHHDKTTVVQTDGVSTSINLTVSDRLSLHFSAGAETRIHHAGERIAAFRLEVDNPDFPFLPGYSGAPLVDIASGAVVGVISIREGTGQRGLAIAAREARALWPDRADMLFPAIDLRALIDEPIMNLEKELPEFTRIVARENPRTRLLNIHGESGRGKTLLLNLYRRIAAAHDIPCLPFELARTDMSFERCLHLMVAHFGSPKFPQYDAYAEQGRGTKSEDEWQRNLTRKFFNDASADASLKPLLVVFDSYNADRPEESFKRWLNDCLLPGLPHCPALLVVVAGQVKLDLLPTLEPCCQSFELQCLALHHFQEYAAQWNAPLPPPVIEAVCRTEQGKPKLFVDMVRACAPVSGGAA